MRLWCSIRTMRTVSLLLVLLFTTGTFPVNARPSAASQDFAGVTCGYVPQVDQLLGQLSTDAWESWVRQLSGAEAVVLDGQKVLLSTRFSPALFDGSSRAYDFTLAQISAWYPASQIEEDAYLPYSENGPTWKNLVLTIPGTTNAGEVVILSAHLDSTSSSPNEYAPGADDNASGAAALFEAARILRGTALPRTLRLIWFTGEEQGLLGSMAYVSDPGQTLRLDGVVGVINVDMIGYDGDGDRCFELHVGTLPDSGEVGRCFTRAIETYGLNLSYDYLTDSATTRSDHASFWGAGIGALEVLENASNNSSVNGCTWTDANPYYHSIQDTLDNMMPAYGFEVSRAALAAAFSMASPVPAYNEYLPFLMNWSYKASD